jgi:hypothetical protein
MEKKDQIQHLEAVAGPAPTPAVRAEVERLSREVVQGLVRIAYEGGQAVAHYLISHLKVFVAEGAEPLEFIDRVSCAQQAVSAAYHNVDGLKPNSVVMIPPARSFAVEGNPLPETGIKVVFHVFLAAAAVG